eukprot:CAMPEP_0168373498 /NCGR_PEP_ID=MMETSP0228-20121227/8819_1 /TAXON_ID=133427 /ORGANISM="Protoceratium reticulatum, Strain CCCM 535 (=CCMP 1889)" /LENGTH=99 /DNA_ID=CAMNT_0008386421 /DNA_START=136 /DNA_END=433 /DNA_ORIENTATION=-
MPQRVAKVRSNQESTFKKPSVSFARTAPGSARHGELRQSGLTNKKLKPLAVVLLGSVGHSSRVDLGHNDEQHEHSGQEEKPPRAAIEVLHVPHAVVPTP